jgi:hypothetical protein
MSGHQDAEQNHNIKTANKFVENVAKFKCLGVIERSQNYIHEEIKNKLNCENSESFVFPSLIYKREVENIQNYSFICCCMGVKLGLSRQGKNIG